MFASQPPCLHVLVWWDILTAVGNTELGVDARANQGGPVIQSV